MKMQSKKFCSRLIKDASWFKTVLSLTTFKNTRQFKRDNANKRPGLIRLLGSCESNSILVFKHTADVCV